jgi:hypothetical protein
MPPAAVVTVNVTAHPYPWPVLPCVPMGTPPVVQSLKNRLLQVSPSFVFASFVSFWTHQVWIHREGMNMH